MRRTTLADGTEHDPFPVTAYWIGWRWVGALALAAAAAGSLGLLS